MDGPTDGPDTNQRTTTDRNGPQRVLLCFLAAQKAAGEAIPQRKSKPKFRSERQATTGKRHEDETTEQQGSKDRQQHQKVSAYVFYSLTTLQATM